MPFVDVSVIEDELSPEQAERLIQEITDAVTSVTSEKLRDVTWVTIREVKSGHWGIGGRAVGLADVKRLMGEG